MKKIEDFDNTQQHWIHPNEISTLIQEKYPYITDEKMDLLCEIICIKNKEIHGQDQAIDAQIVHIVVTGYGWATTKEEMEKLKNGTDKTWPLWYDLKKKHDFNRYEYRVIGKNLYFFLAGTYLSPDLIAQLESEPYSGQIESIQFDEYDGGYIFA